MPTRPTDGMDWANSAAPADVVYPPAGLEAAGYANNDPVSHENLNGLLERISEHFIWLREIFDGSIARIDEPDLRISSATNPVEFRTRPPSGVEQELQLTGANNVYASIEGIRPSTVASLFSPGLQGLLLGQENLCKASAVFRMTDSGGTPSLVIDDAYNFAAPVTASGDGWYLPVANNGGVVRGEIQATIGYRTQPGTPAPVMVVADWETGGASPNSVFIYVFFWNGSGWTLVEPGSASMPAGYEFEIHVEVK